MKQFILFIFISMLALMGCHDVKIGFLKVEDAEYVPNTMTIPAKLVTAEENPKTNDQIRIDNNSPWVTNAISGVLGTEPLQYEFVSVEATEGGRCGFICERDCCEGAWPDGGSIETDSTQRTL